MHARTIGIENPHDLDRQIVLAAIIEEQRLGATLAFIVTGARTDRIDVAPVVFDLRMNIGIAIDFRCRRLQNFRPDPLGQAQHVDRAVHAGLGGLHRIALIMNGRRGARQIVDLVDLHVEREGHVVADQFETLVVQQMLDIAARAAEEIIDADDVGALRKQPLAKVRAEKTRPAGYQDLLFKMHPLPHQSR